MSKNYRSKGGCNLRNAAYAHPVHVVAAEIPAHNTVTISREEYESMLIDQVRVEGIKTYVKMLGEDGTLYFDQEILKLLLGMVEVR